MRRGWRPLSRALLLCLLAGLTLPGDGNVGSVTGICHCDKRISSSSPPGVRFMGHLRKHLKDYNRCPSYVRFQVWSSRTVWTVCGSSEDQWVRELLSCSDRKECGRPHPDSQIHQKHRPPPSTRIPEPTEGPPPDMSTSVPTQPTQQPTFLPGAPSSGRELLPLNETPTPTGGYNVGAGPEAEANRKKQVEEKAEAASGTSALVPVLSLLAIVFVFAAVLLYMLCKRRQRQPRYSPELWLHYTPVTSDSRTEAYGSRV